MNAATTFLDARKRLGRARSRPLPAGSASSKRRRRAGRRERRTLRTALERIVELTEAGFTTADALELAAATRGASGPALARVAAAVRGGRPLSRALAEAFGAIDASGLALLKAGEASGALDRTLALLLERIDEQARTGARLTRALAYPLAVLGVSVAVVLFVAESVLPAFAELAADGQGTLPPTARALVTVARIVRTYAPATLIFATLLAVFGAVAIRRSGRAALVADACLLATPLLGPTYAAREKSRACRTLALLLDGGLEIAEALEWSARSTRSPVLRGRLERVATSVTRGLSLSRAWQRAGCDPSGNERGLLEIGEATGGYDRSFAQLASLHTSDYRARIGRIEASLEPAALMLLAAVVGSVAVAVYEPILGAAGAVLEEMP